jgi:hypothetical protein
MEHPRPTRGQHVQFQQEAAYSIDDPSHKSKLNVNREIRRASKTIDLVKDVDGVNEASPLLPPRASEDLAPLPPLESIASPNDSDDSWNVETPYAFRNEDSRSSWYMLLLTLCMLG